MAVPTRKRKRRKKIKLTCIGKVFVSLLIICIAGGVFLLNPPERVSDNGIITGTGSPLESVSYAENTPVPTPEPTAPPSPTPTIRLLAATPIPENVATPTPTPALKSRVPTREETLAAVDGKLVSSGVNLRAGPSTNDKVVATGFSKGTRVHVFARENDFYFVQIKSNGAYGFVSCKFVSCDGFTPEPITTQVPTGAVGGKVTASSLTLRKGPGIDYDALNEYVKDTEVYIYFQVNDWYYVQVARDGRMGYMKMQYINAEAIVPAGTPVPY